MKCKFSLALLFAGLMTLGACSPAANNNIIHNEVNFDEIEANEYTNPINNRDLGTFSLVSPSDGAIVNEAPTFTWEACDNADTYTLEICEDIDFISHITYIEYYKQTNLTSTSFKIQSELRNKDTTYYWRVTAENGGHTQQSENFLSFYLKALEVDEVSFDIGEADDWLLHSGGSHADISIDNSNFFGNDKPSLALTFKQEDTNQGIPASDGWIIVTRTIEKSIYGTDALMLNMFYAGNDARLLIRLVDRDNEYWFCEVQISNNAKQTVFLKFSDFEQRFADVPVSNRHVYDERIKYMEVVFEKCFGDGVCLISDVKAIKYSNYKDRFIDKLHFDQYNDSDWVNENHEFVRDVNGDELNLSFTSINCYGFAKLVVNRNFEAGDAIKISTKYTGVKGSNILLRIYEEDTDRWAYRIPYSSLTEDTYSTIVIPFNAFAKSSLEGDGKRQFGFIINLQFGLEGAYGTGTISFKDFEIVDSKDYKTEDKRVVEEDGMIEDFSKYTSSTELFFIWQVSSVNKEEYMSLDTEHAIGSSKKQCAKFEYKSDMEEATYILETSVGNYDFKALNLRLKDNNSVEKPTKVDIFIQIKTGEQYVYSIPALANLWNEYNIPFTSFVRYNGTGGNDIIAESIVGIAIGLQYFNKGMPLYTNGNSIFVDDIKLTNNTKYSVEECENVIRPDGDYAWLEKAEDYVSDADVLNNWYYNSSYGYELIKLSNDVSSEGGTHSLAMQYKGKSNSPSYAMATTIHSSVAAKGITIDIKGDDLVTIYINIYVNVNGTMMQYRATLTNVSSEWKSYSIGFSNFELVSSTTGKQLLSSMVPGISRVTFGAVAWSASDYSLRTFYIDNYRLDNSLTYSTNTVRTIA